MSWIMDVEPMEDYLLQVHLDNGSSVLLNLKSRLTTVRFGPLKDPIFFKEATTDGQFIKWRNQIEISINEVFQLARK